MILFTIYRNGEELVEISSSLNLTELGLSDEGNYSCEGVNSLGNGEPDFLLLEVSGSDPLKYNSTMFFCYQLLLVS